MRALQELSAEHGPYVGVQWGTYVFEDGYMIVSYEDDRHFSHAPPASEYHRLGNQCAYWQVRLSLERDRHEKLAQEFTHRATVPKQLPLPDDWREQLGAGRKRIQELKEKLRATETAMHAADPRAAAMRAASRAADEFRERAAPVVSEIQGFLNA